LLDRTFAGKIGFDGTINITKRYHDEVRSRREMNDTSSDGLVVPTRNYSISKQTGVSRFKKKTSDRMVTREWLNKESE
jgi:hypothetical protein